MAFIQDDQSDDIFDSFIPAPRKREVLLTINKLIDWKKLRRIMAVAYDQNQGRKGYDPVILFKLLLLQSLYQLSDTNVVDEAWDRLSFRSFLGIRTSSQAPEPTTLVKFRNRLREAGILDGLYDEIMEQLQAHGVAVQSGSLQLIDATIIAAAPSAPAKDTPVEEKIDPDASFTRKNGKYYYGYKLHIAQDRATGLITGHKTTPAHVHDSVVFEELLASQAPGCIMADKAYDNTRIHDFCKTNNIRNGIMRQARKNHPLSDEQKQANLKISKKRGFVEGAAASLKRYLRCARAVYIGLERTNIQFTIAVVAHNLKRSAALYRDNCA